MSFNTSVGSSPTSLTGSTSSAGSGGYTPIGGGAFSYTLPAGPTPGQSLGVAYGGSSQPSAANMLGGIGNFVSSGTDLKLSDFLKGNSTQTDLYVEGITPSDPNTVTITVKIDPTGDFASGDKIITDHVTLTVASLQLVYTDVTGISHANPTAAFTANMDSNRIAPNKQPGGIAADWQNGVDDGSLLLVRAVGSQAIQTLITENKLTLDFGQLFPHIGTGIYSLQSDGSNGELLPLSTWQSNLTADTALKGVQTNTNPAQGSTRWEGTAAGGAALDVLGVQFYEPPAEFLPQGESSNAFFRQIHVGVSLNYANTSLPALYAGAKPGSLMLTRPPVVFVHGINSDPYSAWQQPGGMAQYLQSQKYIITPFSFADHSGAANDYGSGPLTSDWQTVQNAVEATTEYFRNGLASYSIYNPDIPSYKGTPTFESTGLAYGTLIAVQKVDVVAHSYGGLLTRWYMEQAADPSGGKLFEDFRNIRTLVELGTPNLGSPLANMVDAIYNNPLIGNADINSTLLASLAGPTEMDVLKWLGETHLFGLFSPPLPTSADGKNPYPFFEDAAVNSPLLAQLNADATVFSNDVSYAAVYGTQTDFEVKGIPLLPLFAEIQPLAPNGNSYFPWIQQFDGANNDSVVPTYSAMLPDTAYNVPIFTDHVDLESDPRTEQQVIAWLDNPNLPLGSTQRGDIRPSNGTQNQAFVVSNSDKNAYAGGNIGSNGEFTGAGLNPDAIAGVQLDRIDYSTTTWDAANSNDTGAQYPVFTGMVQVSQLSAGVNFSVNANYDEVDGVKPSASLGSFYLYGQNYTDSGSYLYVAPQYLENAGPDDYVPFSINLANKSTSTIAMGRGVDESISSPYMSAPFELGGPDSMPTPYADISYSLNNLTSAATILDVPAYTPPAPAVSAPNAQNQVMVTLNGAYQVLASGSGTYATVSLYSDGGAVGSDILMAQYQFNDINPAGTAVYWTGLAINYSETVTLTLSDYTLSGPLGSAPWNDGLFQQLDQSLIGKLKSGDAYVPGS